MIAIISHPDKVSSIQLLNIYSIYILLTHRYWIGTRYRWIPSSGIGVRKEKMVVCVVFSFLKLECVEHSEPPIQQMILLRKPRSFITLMLKSFTNIVAIKQTCSLICHHSETWTLTRVLLCFYFHCSLPTTGTKFGPRCCCTDTKCNTHKHNKCNRHFATAFVLTGLYYDTKKEQWESIFATIRFFSNSLDYLVVMVSSVSLDFEVYRTKQETLGNQGGHYSKFPSFYSPNGLSGNWENNWLITMPAFEKTLLVDLYQAACKLLGGGMWSLLGWCVWPTHISCRRV